MKIKIPISLGHSRIHDITTHPLVRKYISLIQIIINRKNNT
jgi:hypothetical protein